MKKVVFAEAIHERGIAMLKEVAEVVMASEATEAGLMMEIKDADALVVRGSRVTEKMIAAGQQLKVIGSHGIGVDHIDIAAASAHGVLVVNTPEANSLSVAEYAVAAMLFMGKRFREADAALRGGVFQQPGSLCGLVTKLGYTAVELCGKTLGLVGFGRIARQLGRICSQGFQMNVISHDPFVSPETMEQAGVTSCEDLEAVFRKADFISVHAPFTTETENLINEKHFRLMKAGAFFIHASRGGVVNEADLYQALKSKRIGGAAVDVFVEEPPSKNHPLFQLDNVLVTPHMAAMTDGALLRMAEDLATGVIDVLKGKQPHYLVNSIVIKR
jgi:D-3-phosphoglycerate dehydrogenase